jgi:dipeptidase E
MRLYLSSYRIGDHGQRLLELVDANRRASVIMNGMDGFVATKRAELFERTQRDLAELGFEVTELDLRAYFDSPEGLRRDLERFDLVWANGGNAFTLNMAMRQSGFAAELRDLLRADALVYGGYSAGAVVAGDTLRGIELIDPADPAEAVPPGYRADVSWQGLGLVEYAVVPHYRSDHWESERIEEVVRYYMEEEIPYRALRDGEVILVDGLSHEHLTSRRERL